MPLDYKATLLSLLTMTEDAGDDAIQNRVSEIVKEAAGQARRIQNCAQLANEHKTLKERFDKLLNEQVDLDLEKFKDVITDKESVKAQLLVNREGTVKFLSGIKKPEEGKGPLFNRKDAGRPQPVSEELPESKAENALAAKISNRASELRKSGLQFQRAWDQAKKEFAPATN